MWILKSESYFVIEYMLLLVLSGLRYLFGFMFFLGNFIINVSVWSYNFNICFIDMCIIVSVIVVKV